jgi:hypothetical protein
MKELKIVSMRWLKDQRPVRINLALAVSKIIMLVQTNGSNQINQLEVKTLFEGVRQAGN